MLQLISEQFTVILRLVCTVYALTFVDAAMITNILPVFLTFFFLEFVHSLSQCHGHGTTISIGDRQIKMYIWTAKDEKWCIARTVSGRESIHNFSTAEEICSKEFPVDGSLLRANHGDDLKQSLSSTGNLDTNYYWVGVSRCKSDHCPVYYNKDQQFGCVEKKNCKREFFYVCQYPFKETTTAEKPTTTTTKTTTTTTTTPKPTTTTTTTPKPTDTTTVSPTSLYNVSEDFRSTTKYPIYVKNAVLATGIACAIIGTLFLIAAMIVRSKGTSISAAPPTKKVLAQRRNVKSIFKTSETFP